jgi:hypothetical protein
VGAIFLYAIIAPIVCKVPSAACGSAQKKKKRFLRGLPAPQAGSPAPRQRAAALCNPARCLSSRLCNNPAHLKSMGDTIGICHEGEPVTTRPGVAPVCCPFLTTRVPFTQTSRMPVESWCASSNVARSLTVSALKMTTSA